MRDYIEFDFDNFTEEKGLKPFLSLLKKSGFEAVSVDANNKAKRTRGLSNNIQTKKALITVSTGQSFSLEIKREPDGTGVPYAVKIGRKLTPIKNTESLTKAAAEIAQHLKKQLPAFEKAMARRAAKVLQAGKSTPVMRASNKLRLQERRESLSELQSQNNTLRQQRDELAIQSAEKASQKTNMSEQLSAKQQERDELLEQINTIKGDS